MALLVATWAVPGSVRADAYALQEVKNIIDTLKPNVLIVLDTAESMQGLPGENPSRYNAVGADCEDGSRYCRLVNQDGRWAFSGMGSTGMYFGGVPSSCTHTETSVTASYSNSQTSTSFCTASATGTVTSIMGATGLGTGTGTVTRNVTGTGTANATGTATYTGSTNAAATVTRLITNTVSATGTATAPAATAPGTTVSGVTASTIVTVTTTKTNASDVTLVGTATHRATATLTATVSRTNAATVNASGDGPTGVGTATVSAAVPINGSVTRIATVTINGGFTGTDSGTGTVSGTVVLSATGTGLGTGSATGTGTGSYPSLAAPSDTAVVTVSGGPYGTTVNATATTTQTVLTTTVSLAGTGTGTGTGTVTRSGTQTQTWSALGSTISGGGTSKYTGTVVGTATYTVPASLVFDEPWNALLTQTHVKTVTWYDGYDATVTLYSTKTYTGYKDSDQVVTLTLTNTNASPDTMTLTQHITTWSRVATAAGTVGTRFVEPGSISGTRTYTATAVNAIPQSPYTATWTASATRTAYTVGTTGGTATVTATVSGTTSVAIGGASNVAGNATVTVNGTGSGTGCWTGDAVVTAPGTVSATGVQTVSASGTSSSTTTYTGTISATGDLPTSSNTSSCSASATETGYSTDTVTCCEGVATNTLTTCQISDGSDRGRCDSLPQIPTSSAGVCYETAVSCTLDTGCAGEAGDFCRIVKANDGYGRVAPEDCIHSAQGGNEWGRCKRGRTTANTKCAWGATTCNLDADRDFCAEGQPAQMCQDSGMWCRDDSDCPSGDTCGPASSRMMIVKRALRRVITDNADKVSFGFINMYQGPATATSTSLAIYPYVKLASCSTVDVTETKLFTRGELERIGQFTVTSGPSPSGSFSYNGVLYTKASVTGDLINGDTGSGDSRWVIPRGDGSGKYNHYTASWSTCPGSGKPDIRPACDFGASIGMGLYEGSYYTFTYQRGTPVADGSVGSMQQPSYRTTYMGKYFNEGGTCYNLIDAERSDHVNDGIHNRRAYVLSPSATSPYTATGTATGIDTSKEIYVDPPLAGPANGSPCNDLSGAIWNSNAVPFLNQTGTASATATGTGADMALAITTRLEKASLGGVGATGQYAPLGCALNNDGAPGEYFGAAGYMTKVAANDATNNGGNAPCWTNNIVLVVDGHVSGATEIGTVDGHVVDCASTACASESPTWANGCYCPAINKAYSLAQAGVETHVVVNAPASWATTTASYTYPYYTYAFMWNLALAGSRNANFNNASNGTPSFGTTEEEVYKGLSDKIAAAAYRFVYTTTAPVPGATTQDPTTKLLTSSNLLFDTSVNYPAWQGNVRAYNTTPALVWNALGTSALGHPGWKGRRIYFSDKDGGVRKVNIDINTGAIDASTATYLNQAGLGAAGNTEESKRIMQWLLGKPELGNPAPLMGAITSSTPIVVGQASLTGQTGSEAYSVSTWKRPQLLYVGADDGMLHAFFAPASIVTPGNLSFQIGTNTFYAGEEAFAFIPLDMMPVINKLYAQGGQNLSADQRVDGTTNSTKAHRNLLADKGQHVFGLAGSPKVKDMCWGTGCTSSDGSGWHTVLLMTEGPGGNKPFALDITNVVAEDAFNGLTIGAAGTGSLLWSAAVIDRADGTHKWDKALGENTSVPAFYMRPSLGAAANRLLLSSGYPTVPRSTSGYANQGLVVLDVDAKTGDWDAGSPHAMGTTGASSCTSGTQQQQRTVMADIALARDWSAITTSQNLLGAYIGDTWGNTFQYVPGMGTVPLLYTLGCGQPLYFSPAVVQLDKLQTGALSAQHQIYLVQVTNSNLDPDTRTLSADYPGSKLVVTKLSWSGIAGDSPTIDTMYNGTGKIVLATDASAAENRICLGTTSFTKTKADTCSGTDGGELPATARPVGTPTVIMRSDGLGFQVITGWYDWTAHSNNCTANPNFNYGTSYITVHEFGADGSWYQIYGATLTDTVLTGGTFVGAGFFLDGIMGANGDMPSGLNFGQNIVSLQQILNGQGLERYSRTSWTERLE